MSSLKMSGQLRHRPFRSSPLCPAFPDEPSLLLTDGSAKCYIEDIPNELLNLILSFIPFNKAMGGRRTCSLMLVCKRWQVIYEAKVFLHVQMYSHKIGPNSQVCRFLRPLQQNPRIRGHIRSLQFRVNSKKGEWAPLVEIQKILELCLNVRSLLIHLEVWENHENLVNVIKSMPHLEDFELSAGDDKVQPELIIDQFDLSHLRRLSLWHVPLLESDEAVMAQVPPERYGTSRITRLDIDRSAILPSAATKILRLPHQLTSLSITHIGMPFRFRSPFPTYTFQEIQQVLNYHSQSLKEVTIGLIKCDRRIPVIGLPDLTNFPVLEKFTMSGLNLFETTVAHAHRNLQGPELRVLTLQSSLELGSRFRNFTAFKPEWAEWLKNFAAVHTVHAPGSKLKIITIEHQLLDVRPYRSKQEMPKPWPWTEHYRARQAVESAGGGKLKMEITPKPTFTELQWSTAVRQSIMQSDRLNSYSEHEALMDFQRRGLDEIELEILREGGPPERMNG